MLDDDHGMPVIDEAMKHVEQLLHVGHVQADGRLFEQIERRFGLAILPQCARSRVRPTPRVSSLTSLSRCASPPLSVGLGWPSLQIAEAGVAEQRSGRWIFDCAAKKLGGLLQRHLHHVADAALVVEHFERGGVVALAVAIRARQIARRQESSSPP